MKCKVDYMKELSLTEGNWTGFLLHPMLLQNSHHKLKLHETVPWQKIFCKPVSVNDSDFPFSRTQGFFLILSLTNKVDKTLL